MKADQAVIEIYDSSVMGGEVEQSKTPGQQVSRHWPIMGQWNVGLNYSIPGVAEARLHGHGATSVPGCSSLELRPHPEYPLGSISAPTPGDQRGMLQTGLPP